MNTPDDNAPQPIGRATYKGRDYAVLWKGPTQYGDRVKLAFPDDLEETFWIDAARVEAIKIFPTGAGDRPQQRPQQRPRQSRPRRPTDDGPRRRSDPPGPAHEYAPDEPDRPDDSEECYCASCGQPLPQFS